MFLSSRICQVQGMTDFVYLTESMMLVCSTPQVVMSSLNANIINVCSAPKVVMSSFSCKYQCVQMSAALFFRWLQSQLRVVIQFYPIDVQSIISDLIISLKVQLLPQRQDCKMLQLFIAEACTFSYRSTSLNPVPIVFIYSGSLLVFLYSNQYRSTLLRPTHSCMTLLHLSLSLGTENLTCPQKIFQSIRCAC